MSAGSHRGRRPESPDFSSSSEWSQFVSGGRPESPDFSSSSEWSQFVRPEYRNLEIERQIMQSRDQLGSFDAHINNIQQGNISSHGGTRAQGVDGVFQNSPELEKLLELEQAEIDAEIANAKRMEARMKAAVKCVLKRHQEVNGTQDVDLKLRMWFKDEESMNE